MTHYKAISALNKINSSTIASSSEDQTIIIWNILENNKLEFKNKILGFN
jgi:hypothetical protein